MSASQSYRYDALDRLASMNAGYAGATTLATGQGLLPAEAFTRGQVPPGQINFSAERQLNTA